MAVGKGLGLIVLDDLIGHNSLQGERDGKLLAWDEDLKSRSGENVLDNSGESAESLQGGQVGTILGLVVVRDVVHVDHRSLRLRS